MEPFATQHVVLDDHKYPLAADFTAPLAVGLTREKPQKLGIIRMLRPEKYADTARLTRLQPYDANRIPVIFVHGLQDTPATWAPMINALWADPEIRRRYQCWVYSYPSGYPFYYSADLFRRALDTLGRAFPNHKKVVLVGHSMGGLICHLMVIDPGEKIWLDAFGKPPAETNLPAETKELAEECLIFHRRPEVARVIFMSTPHRGSGLATNWIGRIGTSLIKMPFFFASIPIHALSSAMLPNAGTTPLKRIPNSIDTLSPRNRFVREMNKFPISPDVPYHSIIGDRGRGDTPNSSDGVVAYWSSHLDGAQSEKIVPSNHGTPLNPEAVAEVRRILLLHLKSQGKSAPASAGRKRIGMNQKGSSTEFVASTR
ncbi:MAG: esterase/lipase family protein [Chthoniobacterales bacterium]